MAGILVGLDTTKGLVEEITIKCGKHHYQLTLDYEGIPFKCGRFHSHGNLAMKFAYAYQKKVWIQKIQPKVWGLELVETLNFQRGIEEDGNKRASEKSLILPLESEEKPIVSCVNKEQSLDVISDNKFNKFSSCKSLERPSHCKQMSIENFVFGSWGIKVETKGMEYINEFFPGLHGIKNYVSLTLIPLHLNSFGKRKYPSRDICFPETRNIDMGSLPSLRTPRILQIQPYTQR